MELPSCYLCGAPHPTLLGTVQERRTGHPFRVLCCIRCGLGFTVPRPPPAALETYYPPPTHPRAGRGQRLAHGLRAWLRRRRARFAAHELPPGRALEIGCGDGRLLSALQAAGWQVLGVERSPDAALAARHRGVDVCVADVIALGLPTASCDLVIFWHALEHLADPRAALQEARRLLRDGGRLVVAAPNLASWQARLLGVRWYHLDVPRHLFHFTPPTLERLLQETGFQPVAWSFHQPAYELRGWFEALRSALPGPSLSVWAVWMLIAPLAYVWCLVADWAHAGAAMVVHARCRGTAASSPTR